MGGGNVAACLRQAYLTSPRPQVSVPCVVRSRCWGGFPSPAQGLQTERCGPGRSPEARFSSAKNSAGGGWETACGGHQAEARDIQARLKPHFRSGRVVIAAGSARIKVRSSRSVRGPAGRAGEEGEQGAAPGCRGPERADPAPGPSPHTSIPGVRDLRPPWSPISPASDFICREPLCRAPLLCRQSPAIGTARLQPRSATIRPLP
ncbi:hypothetical protein NDU88_003545 [Pleurodeles waltl]|uniref:Uncharacterized protein n=1 Tax=Pleurodeles waltl TaxID=8319 RepID=A0AAV7NGY8_PLEWA|nr:hypothetical protein NDU88_003545 [Pleurodeles waltl]